MGNSEGKALGNDLCVGPSVDEFYAAILPMDSDVLPKSGQLEVPQRLQEWFPPQNANKNVRGLFQWDEEEELGRGATGSVRAVTYRQRRCALKIVDRGNEWAELTFIAEAQILSKLRHRGVVGFAEMFLDEEHFYLVMERGDVDLCQITNASAPWDEATANAVIFALFESVAFLHSNDIVHRDLKPANVVLCRADKGGATTPKLIDFGDALLVQRDASYTDFVGTPQYLAPERLGDHKGWQLKAADVWAVGAIAFELLTGCKCFDGETQREIFAKILGGQWSWPRSRTPSQPMMDLVGRCLSMNAAERPSAEEALSHSVFTNSSAPLGGLESACSFPLLVEFESGAPSKSMTPSSSNTSCSDF